MEPRDTAAAPRIYWANIFFLALTHLAGLSGFIYLVAFFNGWTLGLGLLWMALCMLATTGGYHQLFAHRSYKGAWPVRLFYLLFGAASFQGPALRWASDHRTHHAHTDEVEDPHSIRRGFWWAHIGWLFYQTPPAETRNARDLEADPLIRFQERFYLPLAVAVGMGIPFALGWLAGDPIGGLLVAGFSRLLVQYHATFSINSVAHWVGRRPYSTSTSARDSFVAALATMGEGYHNYHHRFPSDYRNGIRSHHFDPTKWCVWLLAKIGLAWDLKRVPPGEILKARLGAAQESR